MVIVTNRGTSPMRTTSKS